LPQRHSSIVAAVGEGEDWPPPEARLTSALWRAEGHLERHEYSAAAQALDEAGGLGDDELVAALRHLAAAGYRAQLGEPVRAQRQLDHARRRLAAFLPRSRDVDLEALLESVVAAVESADGKRKLA
jgi:hypothetical protein